MEGPQPLQGIQHGEDAGGCHPALLLSWGASLSAEQTIGFFL